MYIKDKITKNNIISITFVIVYFFRQIVYFINPSNGYFLVGNLDLFYLLGILYILKFWKKVNKSELMLLLLILGYILLQILFINNINVIRVIINVCKILLSFFVMKYVIETKQKANITIIVKLFSYLCIIFLLISMIFTNSNILWRHNDTVNVFDLNRIKFLYTEPGELGFHCSIMLIIAFSLLKEQKNKVRFFVLTILPLIITLYFTKSVGAIGVGIVGVISLYISDMLFEFNIKKVFGALSIFIVFTVIIFILANSKSTLYLRVTEIFNNHDSSTRYRIMIPFELVPKILNDTNGIGVGFGNLELKENVDKYAIYGLESEGIINSFMNLIAESGVLGIFLVINLIITLLRKIIKDKSSLKFALFVFIIVYQFMGTYFSNPLCWIIYGYILSSENIKRLEEEKEK